MRAVADLIELLKEASHPRAAIQPRTESLALAVAARAAQGRAWLSHARSATPRCGTSRCVLFAIMCEFTVL